MPTLSARLVGGPTAILEYAGLRWLTDPSLSPPGTYAGDLVKTTGPAVEPDAIGPIDVVLLSHEHHSDNLDPAGREFLPSAGRVLTTVEGAQRIGGNATGFEPWSSVEVERPDGSRVTVTATPARHGPAGSDDVMGPVVGFLLSGEGLPTVYVSGDNASLEVVRAIAERAGGVDVAVLFAGAVQVPYRFDSAYLTLSSDRAAAAAQILGARAVVPVHFEGWTHFTQAPTRCAPPSPATASATGSYLPSAGRPSRSRTSRRPSSSRWPSRPRRARSAPDRSRRGGSARPG